MKKKSILLTILPMMILASCGSNHTVPETPVSIPTGNVDLKTAYSYLSEAHNYQIMVDTTVPRGATFMTSFTDKYVWCDKKKDEWGLGLYKDGVANISYDDNGDLVAGEILKDKENRIQKQLWGSGLFASFADISDEFGDNEKEHVFTNKLNKLSILKLMGLSSSMLLDIKSATTTIVDELTTLDITLEFDYGKYILTVEAVGDTKSVCDSFITSSAPYILDDDLAGTRLAFFEDNYNRDVLDYEDEKLSYGIEHFMPQYFYGEYNSYGAQHLAASAGYLAIKNKVYKDQKLNGTYLFTLTESREVNLFTAGYYNDATNIHGVGFGYMSDLILWNKLELSTYDSKAGCYTFTNQKIVDDFVVVNQLVDSLNQAGYSAYKVELYLDDPKTKEDAVFFKLYYGPDQLGYYAAYKFMDFGRANMSMVDRFIEDNKLYD